MVVAAVFQEKHSTSDCSANDFRRIMEVNIDGTFNCCQAFANSMLARRRGSIVNIASTSAHCGQPLFAYGPSKSAVVNLTKSLAGHWGAFGVRVNSVSPGATLVKRVLARKPGRYAENINSQMALGRRVQPNEVAEGIEFLASGRASAITGVDLLIDSGMLAAAGWGVYGGIPASSDAAPPEKTKF